MRPSTTPPRDRDLDGSASVRPLSASAPFSGLEHPLPTGMRDLLPPETAARLSIAREFLEGAVLVGYEIVIPPAVEYAQTLERGLGTLDPREIVRFVEPETGEVVALRPDVTPQIARLIATRLEGRPGPYRIAYDASVVRRRAGTRARTHRQISQVGVELVGVGGQDGDLELLTLACTSLEALGLPAITVDLGHADIARALLAGCPDPVTVTSIAEALARKDGVELARLAESLDLPLREALLALPTVHGPASVLDALPRALRESPARPAIEALAALVARVEAAHFKAVRITIDLSEVRGLAYYTGPFFQIFADGPGVAIGGGGRYDQLLARFGRPLPGAGFALDVDALVWALGACQAPVLRRRPRAVAQGPSAEAFAAPLRARGIPVAILHEGDAAAYARAWGYTAVVRCAIGSEGIPAATLEWLVSPADEGVSPLDGPHDITAIVAKLSVGTRGGSAVVSGHWPRPHSETFEEE